MDVFFVISGFLITSIVLEEAKAGRFSIRRFWERRIRRILPAMIAMVVISTMIYRLILFHPDCLVFRDQRLASLLSFANFYFWLHTGSYWGHQAAGSPYLHCWSLSVEEQFYLLYPLAVVLIWRRVPRLLLRILAVVVAVSVAVFLYGSRSFPEATFYLLPTRAWELGSGCCLAIMMGNARSAPRLHRLCELAVTPITGMILILLSYSHPAVKGVTAFGAIASVLGTVLIILTPGRGIVYRLLANGLAVYAGKIS